MKYVIVSEVRGKAGEQNELLRSYVKGKFARKISTLPPHFTIKSPFDYHNSIDDLKDTIRDFVCRYQAQPYQVCGYNHFDRRVIYMDVIMSAEAKLVHDQFIDCIEHFPYILWDDKDGKDKVFHVTIASKKIEPYYDVIWDYVHEYPCNFECRFDNISIYRLGEKQWELEERFELL